MTEAACLQHEQQQEQQVEEEEVGAFDEDDERAHAVPGVHAVEHDGVLGVRQSLLDLEPLPDSLLDPQQQQQEQEEEAPSCGGSSGSSGSGYSGGGGGGGGSAPTSSFDPLGAVVHPSPVAPAAGELISLDAGPGESAPEAAHRSGPAAATPPGDMRSQLQDLLL